jgi:hypothetical protein
MPANDQIEGAFDSTLDIFPVAFVEVFEWMVKERNRKRCPFVGNTVRRFGHVGIPEPQFAGIIVALRKPRGVERSNSNACPVPIDDFNGPSAHAKSQGMGRSPS